MGRKRGWWNRCTIVVRKPRCLASISAVLVGLTLVVRGLEPLIFVALVPFVVVVKNLRAVNSKEAMKIFYLVGFIICGFANYFLFEVSPSNWTVSMSKLVRYGAPATSWLLICLFCSLSFGLLGWSLYNIRTNAYRVALLPFAFGLAELLRSYLYAVMAYGPHGSLSPNFNWGSLAVPASGTVLVYASRFAGFFGLSALVVLVNIGVYLLLFQKHRRFRTFATVILVVVCGTTWLGWAIRPKTSVADSLKIMVVGLKSDESLATWQEKDWPQQGTDLLVLPEYSEFTDNPEYKQILQHLSDTGMAITTIKQGRSPRATNQLIILNNKGQIVSAQDKTFLIPTGETLPYSLRAVFKLSGNKHLITNFDYTQQMRRGEQKEYVFSNGSFSVGALACSGVSALSEYSRLNKEGADVLVNSASLSFLQPESRYHVYARNMARFQSVSTGKPFVQASRSGESYVVSSTRSFSR